MSENLPARNMDEMGGSDLAVPEIKLVQNVGGDEAKTAGAKPGDFYLSLTGEIIPGTSGFQMVIVDMQKNRTFWGRDSIDSDPPQCACMNADLMLSMDGRDCKACEHRCDTPWLLKASERRTKCTVNYNILAIKIDKDGNDLPVLIRTTGISTQAAREILTQLRLNKTLNRQYHRALITATSLSRKSPSGSSFAMSFKLVTKLVDDPARIEQLLATSKQILGTTVIALPEGREAEEPVGTTEVNPGAKTDVQESKNPESVPKASSINVEF